MNINTLHSSRLALVALALSMTVVSASAAQIKMRTATPPPPSIGKIVAKPSTGHANGVVETCNNIASCNLMISYCISHGGDWQETGPSGPQGQPQKGKCTYP